MNPFYIWLDQRRDFGVLLLRLFISFRLIYGVQDNIFSWDKMKEFEGFLAAHNFPLPILCAVVSVYAQAVVGLLILLGWKTRVAALLMIINFLVALIVVHRNDSIEVMTPALAVLFACILFLFQGAGKYSIDKGL